MKENEMIDVYCQLIADGICNSFEECVNWLSGKEGGQDQ